MPIAGSSDKQPGTDAACGLLSLLCGLQAEEGDAAEAVMVQQEDFMAALGQLVPSLSPQELQRYQTLQQQFKPAS